MVSFLLNIHMGSVLEFAICFLELIILLPIPSFSKKKKIVVLE